MRIEDHEVQTEENMSQISIDEEKAETDQEVGINIAKEVEATVEIENVIENQESKTEDLKKKE